MASSVDILPSLGHGLVASQVGPSAGYDAIDIRRLAGAMRSEGVLSTGSYLVSQRAAGANLSVDVAASTGNGALVLGDSVTGQSLYYVTPHTTVISLDVAAANATNPRNDLVVLEIKDDTHDVGGLNVSRVRIISGTATAGAAMTDAFGVNGTPALPASCLALAVVNVPATDTTIADAQINDRRSILCSTGVGGRCIIATSEARTNVAFGLLTTPDIVRNVVLPTDGLIAIVYHATWQESVSSAARAAIFIGATQLKGVGAGTPTPGVSQTSHTHGASDQPLFSTGGGLDGTQQTGGWADVTTGQIIGGKEASGTYAGQGGPCYVFAAAGTYDISVQFNSTSGSVTAQNRKLWVWTQAFG